MTRPSIDARSAAIAGAIGGLGAGLVLTLVMTLTAAATGGDLWYGIKGAAAPFLGSRAMAPGFDAVAVLLGLATHLAICFAWGVPFGLMARRLDAPMALGAGVLYGFVVWIGMYYVALPLVGLAQMRDAPIGGVIAFHVLFSSVLAAAFLIDRRMIERSERFRRATPRRTMGRGPAIACL